MKFKVLITFFILFCFGVNAQKFIDIPAYLGYDKLEKFGIVHSVINEEWKLPIITGNKPFFDFNEFLVKGISDDNNVILTIAELKHIAKIGRSKILYYGNKTRNPSTWENLPPYSPKIVFHDSVSFIIISKGKMNICKSSTLKAKKYFTYYPRVTDVKLVMDFVPVEYAIDSFQIKSNETSLFIAGSTNMIEKLINNKPTISVDTARFGTRDIPGILITTKIDLNNDGQIDIVKFYEKIVDHVTDKGDIGADFLGTMVAVLYKNKWYRTAFRQTGQDGIEGF
jgi:hypothetical protein